MNEGWMEGKMDGWMEGRVDERKGGWKEGWMEEGKDGWMEVTSANCACSTSKPQGCALQ